MLYRSHPRRKISIQALLSTFALFGALGFATAFMISATSPENPRDAKAMQVFKFPMDGFRGIKTEEDCLKLALGELNKDPKQECKLDESSYCRPDTSMQLLGSDIGITNLSGLDTWVCKVHSTCVDRKPSSDLDPPKANH